MACYVSNRKNTAHHRDARRSSQNSNPQVAGSPKINKPAETRKCFNRAMDVLAWMYDIASRIPGFSIRPALNTPAAESQALASSGQYHKATIRVGEVSQALTNCVNAFLRNTVEHHQKMLASYKNRKVSATVLSSEFDPAFTELSRAREVFVKQLAPQYFGLPDYEAMIIAMNKMVEAEESVEERIRRSFSLEHRHHNPNPGLPSKRLLQMPTQSTLADVPIHTLQTAFASVQISA
jgi:hypothetical protein